MKYSYYLFILLISFQAYCLDVPQLMKPVTDHANMIGTRTERTLNNLLRRVHGSRQLQMAILTIDDLKDETLEGYSIKVVDTWKLGDRGRDKGILLLIAKRQRKIRLEVGQGLEGDIPDAYAKRIIDGMGPYFRANQVDDGIMYAVASVFKRAGIKEDGLHYKKRKSKYGKVKNSLITLFIFIFIFIILFRRNPYLALAVLNGSSHRGYGGRYSSGGGFSGGGFSGGGGGFSGGGASGGW